jgi:PLP dependent protein
VRRLAKSRPSSNSSRKLSLPDRLAGVRARIDAAARSVGRNPASVRLVAVSKTFPLDAINAAYEAGQRDFGENRVQEALVKIGASRYADISWHLLGHLQTNKARRTVSAFHTIHSVDSLELLRKLDLAATDAGASPELLIQVDLAQEPTKFGATPDVVSDLLAEAANCRAAQVVGLMTIPPAVDDPEHARPWFQRLREHRDEWLTQGVPEAMLRELSMGMSGDFAVAIQEGATIVRVGTAIFGERPALMSHRGAHG